MKPVRVLYVENGIGYGGAIICLRHLVRHLDRSRYVPLVVTGRGGPPYDDLPQDAPWILIPDRRFDPSALRRWIAGLRWPRRLPGARALLEQLVARLDDLLNFLPFFLRLLWVARREGIRLIHANNEPLCNRAALLVGRILRIPVVCHVRGDQTGSRMMRWLYGLPDHFIAVSHWIADGVRRQGVPAERCTVVYDGIALEALDLHADGSAFRARYGIPQDATTVGLVGLLIPWKGQELFLDAARRMLAKEPGLHLVIAGGTPEECLPYERALRERVERDGMAARVTFTGHVTDMAAAYNGLDIVVSASTLPEPLGTMVIETMAMGRALVAPAHGGGAEMNEHDVTALLFRPNDADALADAILRLARDPALRARLGSAAREKALRTFAVAQHVAGVQAVYEKVLAERGGTGDRSAESATSAASNEGCLR